MLRTHDREERRRGFGYITWEARAAGVLEGCNIDRDRLSACLLGVAGLGQGWKRSSKLRVTNWTVLDLIGDRRVTAVECVSVRWPVAYRGAVDLVSKVEAVGRSPKRDRHSVLLVWFLKLHQWPRVSLPPQSMHSLISRWPSRGSERAKSRREGDEMCTRSLDGARDCSIIISDERSAKGPCFGPEPDKQHILARCPEYKEKPSPNRIARDARTFKPRSPGRPAYCPLWASHAPLL